MVDSIETTMVTTSSTTYVSGLSGFDSSALIEAAVQAKLAPAYVLEAEVSEEEAILTAYQEMETLLESMEDALNNLRNEPGTLSDPSSFEKREAYLSVDDSSTASNYLGVSVDENTEPASYEVEIQQLATAHKLGSDSQTSKTDPAGLDGSFTLGIDRQSAPVNVSADMSLEDIRDAINDVSDDSGVTASILKVSDNAYMLILSASDTGQDISFASTSGDDITTSLGLTQGDGSVKNELQTAQNAIISIDGITIERSQNTIDDAIEGVTLDLYGANAGATFTVEIDYAYSSIKEDLLAFVDAYNAYRDFALTHQEVDSEGDVSADAVLFGDSVLRSVNNSIYDILTDTTEVDGVSYSFASLGITFDDENRLSVDEAEMDAFLLENIETVAKMFEFQFSSNDENLMVLSHSGQITPGTYDMDITIGGDGSISDVSIGGDSSHFEISGTTITGVSGSPFDGMTFVYTGTTSKTVTFDISQGFADTLYNKMDNYTNPVDGLLVTAQRDLEESISTHESEIASIEASTSAEETRLIGYYAALEAKIAEANALSDYLEAITNSDD